MFALGAAGVTQLALQPAAGVSLQGAKCDGRRTWFLRFVRANHPTNGGGYPSGEGAEVRLVVFGAAGRMGRLVVDRALGHGHEVTAFVHSSLLGFEHPRLTTVHGDVLDFDAVSSAVEGQRAVASVLGIGSRGTPHLYSEGVASIVHAMAVHEVRKLAAVSAAGVGSRKDPNLGLGARMIANVTMRAVYDDLERMEQRIMASDLDWTIVRPSGLSDEPQSGRYRMTRDGSVLPKSDRISRADVAAVVLTALETDEYVRRILTVAG